MSATQLSDLLKPMLRRAGITQLPGVEPSMDQYGELISEVNRMMAGYNLDGHKIYTTEIARYALVANEQQYLIGPTASSVGASESPAVTGFDADRPNFIYRANLVILGSSPEVHEPIRILTPAEWAALTLPHLQASWPWALYNDGGSPNSRLYLYGYPDQVNDLELFTWSRLETSFGDVTDAVLLPDGYEDMMVTCGALRARSLYPYDSKLSALQVRELESAANRAVQAVKIMNTQCPPMVNEASLLNSGGSGGNLRAEFYKWGANLD